MNEWLHLDVSVLLDSFLAMLALINPISKMFIVSSFPPDSFPGQLRRVSVKSSLIAIAILISFTLFGYFLLNTIFHVKIFAFKVAGGIVLLLRGFTALNKGIFFDRDAGANIEEMSIVPLASPMIAGPATITASVSFPSRYGVPATLIAIVAAVLVNLLVMVNARRMVRGLSRYNIMGALIRITGLIVATIGIQMVMDGISDYLNTIQFENAMTLFGGM